MSAKIITSKHLLTKASKQAPDGGNIADISMPVNLSQSTEDSANYSQKSLGELFNEIDSKYSSGLLGDREVPSLDRLALSDISAEDILSDAKIALEADRVTGLSKIEADNLTKERKLESQKNTAIKDADTDIKKLAEKYDANVEPIKAGALSRGLARSSIVANQLSENELNKQSSLYAVDRGLMEELNTINQNISVLDAQKQNALNAFDIAYAAKLEDKINKLTQDAEKKNQEIIKYNNTITRQEETMRYNQEQELLKRIGEYAKIRDSNTADYFAELARSEKLQATFDYLNSYSKADAIALASNSSDIKSALGKSYATLLNWLNLRDA